MSKQTKKWNLNTGQHWTTTQTQSKWVDHDKLKPLTHENQEFRFLASEKQHPLYFGQIRSLVSCPHSISQWSRFSFSDLQFGPPQKTHELIGFVCHTSCAGFPNCGFSVRVSLYGQQWLYFHWAEDSSEWTCNIQTDALCILDY